MSVYYDFTNEGLKKMLTELLAQPDFLTVSKRDIVSSFLCSHLHGFGYVAMTHEEIILRSHYDYRGRIDGPKVRTVDLDGHANLFVQLGIFLPHHQIAYNMVKEIAQRMVDMGILVFGNESDGQSGYVTTRPANPKLSVDDAVWELRRKMR
jgi:hypothetical protein